MHLHLLALLSLAALAQAQWKSCASWFGKKNKWTVDAECHDFPGYPRTIHKTKVTVAYTRNWAKLGVKAKLIAPVLQKSIDASIDYYDGFATLPDQMVVILSTAVDGKTTAETIYPNSKKPPCQVTLFKRWTSEAAGTNVPRALQAVAHELYHCVQGLKLGNVKEPGWIIEGSAGYFSNLVFPDSNVEWPDKLHKYNPALPIYAQGGDNIYAASLYFQALETVRSTEYLNHWVLATVPTNIKYERNRLSRLSGFIDDLYVFAELLSLRDIHDTDGRLISTQPQVKSVSAPVLLDKAGTTGTATLHTIPDSVTVFKLSLKPGQVVEIYSDATFEQRVAYRSPSSKSWKEMPTGPGVGHAGQAALPCNDKGEDESIFVLFISTADVKKDKVKITTKHYHTTNCQKRGGFVLYPLLDPATDGAKCPKGTHLSDRAAWCCPDGMQLDDPVASEIDICCPTSADCSGSVVPDNLRCADPKWDLWSMDFEQIGCCMQGYVPTALRFCVKDHNQLGPGYTMIPQA